MTSMHFAAGPSFLLSLHSGGQFLCLQLSSGHGEHHLLHNGLTGDDADKNSPVIHHGNKALAHGVVQQVIHGDPHADRRVKLAAHHRLQRVLLMLPQAVVLLVHHMPEEVPLGNSAQIHTVPAENGQRGIAADPEFLHTLTDGIVVIQVGYLCLRRQKGDHIHKKAPFAKFLLCVNYTIPFCENHQRTVN